MEYAGNRSREKQSLLLRDLKLGVNHIDREQLRRNGLYRPRYPTEIVEFSASVEDAVQTTDDRGDFFGAPITLYKVRCVAEVRVVAPVEDIEESLGYHQRSGKVGTFFREEWVVFRSFKEFQSIHKHLKNQVSASMSSGTAGSRLVGAAAAAFASNAGPHGRHSQRQSLVPSLSQASKAGALGVTKKSIVKRKEILNGYLGFLLARGHLLSRNSELLLFLGAFYPFPPGVSIGKAFCPVSDPLGRMDMLRTVVRDRLVKEIDDRPSAHEAPADPLPPTVTKEFPTTSVSMDAEAPDDDDQGTGEENDLRSKKIDMIPSIRAKIEKVPLSQVRNRIFELLRYQFGFENASFIRNRMLAALKTASFAVTSSSEFRRTLYNAHLEYLSASGIADMIQFGSDLLWPNGVFFESAPPWSEEQLVAQAAESKELLHQSFPEQLRAILGQELTRDGLDIFHEMLQNRVVVKSMAYMLFDLLWLEVFPEIGDVLQCGAALDLDQP